MLKIDMAKFSNWRQITFLFLLNSEQKDFDFPLFNTVIVL